MHPSQNFFHSLYFTMDYLEIPSLYPDLSPCQRRCPEFLTHAFGDPCSVPEGLRFGSPGFQPRVGWPANPVELATISAGSSILTKPCG
jgi:hypothetical protein